VFHVKGGVFLSQTLLGEVGIKFEFNLNEHTRWKKNSHQPFHFKYTIERGLFVDIIGTVRDRCTMTAVQPKYFVGAFFPSLR
jgi:hypothetical protein